MKQTLAKVLLATLGLTTAIPTAFAANPPAAARKFTDLATVSAERQAAILQAQQLGLLGGDSQGRFRPFGLTSRQEMAVVLAATLRLPLKSVTKPSFGDVKKTDWSASAIEAVYRAGLMNGVGQGKFRPAAALTYEELAVILDRAAQWQTNVHDDMSAKVEQVSAWAKPAVSRAFAEGVMGNEPGGFQPKGFLQRQALAEIVIDVFFPQDHASALQQVTDESVRINGIKYELAGYVKGVLRAANAEALEGAKIRFVANGRTIERITSLEITKSGTEPKAGEAEFSGNVTFDGNGGTLDGNLTVSGDFLSVNHVNVAGDLEVSSKLSHDFYSNGLKVTGNTLVKGGDSNTVVFNNASLGPVTVNKQDVRVETLGNSLVGNVTIASNASLVIDNNVTIPKLTLQEGASKVELTGTVASLEVTGNQGTQLTGNANIGELKISSPGQVSLNITGTVQQLTVNNPNAAVTLGSESKVSNVSLGEGVSASAVTTPPPPPAPTNQAPVIERTLPDLTFDLSDGDQAVDVTGLFRDPDNDKLTVAPQTSDRNIVKASLSGNTVKLTPVAAGQAVITMRVTDGKGHVVTTPFNVTVTNVPNLPPVGIDIPSQSMALDAAASVIDLSTYFSDPELRALTYTATVQDSAFAQAVVTGDKLDITPLAVGSTTIDVTATDPKNAATTKTINLTVTPANQPPIGLALPDQSLEAGASAKELDLSNFFADPEQGTLTYTATVQDSAFAQAVVTGDKLGITPLAVGSTTIDVTATDARGAHTSRTINLTVTAAVVTPPSSNGPPQVMAAIQKQVLSPGYANPRTYDLSQLFEDPDGDALTYSVVVSDPSAVQATVNGSSITISPGTVGHPGAVTVSITATDSGGLSATYDLSVLEVQLVDNGFVAVNTKTGVPNLTYDLKSQFPGQTSFSVYYATPDQTLIGPTPLNGTAWSGTPMNGDYYIVGANNKAVLLRVNVKPQISGEAYFSEYIDGGNYSKTFQIRNAYSGTSQKFIGYSVDVYHYDPGTNAITSSSTKIFDIPADQIQDLLYVNVIDRAFYEFFDLINTPYYNEELILNIPNQRLTAIVLKHNGVVVDALGDPTSHEAFMPNGGTIVRKAAINSASATFSLTGEWNVYPTGTYQYYSQQTP